MKTYARPELTLQPLEQVEHLGLHRHVEGRHRFVGDDEPGAGGQRAGDADPLAPAAGQLARLAFRPGDREADLLQQLLDPGAALLAGGDPADLEHLPDRTADRLVRVQ